MNILHALFFPPEQPGGVSSMVPYICEGLNKKGWNAELFYIPKRVRDKGDEEFSFQTMDVSMYAQYPIVDKYLQTLKDYLWWAKRQVHKTYDLIHAHHPIAALVMKKLFPKTPVVMTVHSSYERELLLNGRISENGPEQAFLTSLYRELEATVDHLITVSRSFRQYLSKYVEKPERITVIYNGFDRSRFRPIHHDNSVPQIITVCRLVPAKGVDVLLKACSEIKKRGHDFVLHVIGDGPIREQLERMASDLGIYDETIFYGYMLHPEQFMPFSDIFCLPSRAEAFGSVFAEAALCLLAPVGTSVGGIAEQIEHGKNGLLVPVDDVNALADALELLIEKPEYRKELAQNAYEKAIREFSLERVIAHLTQIYLQYAKFNQPGYHLS